MHDQPATMKPIVFLLLFLSSATCLLPPKFEWKSLDFKWHLDDRASLRALKEYVPENTAPSGIARWKNKLFITLPKWKKGIPSSLNYIKLNGDRSQPLRPYPSWYDAFVPDNASGISSNATVVSAFRAHVDECDRLWVADNGVINMASSRDLKQISNPAIVIFDLNNDRLIRRFELPPHVLKDSSVLNSIVVDIVGDDNQPCRKHDAYAYITDMGSSAIIVYSLRHNEAWRVEHPFFFFDPVAGVYKIGGVRFYWMDGVSSAALSNPKRDGYRDLYIYPTSSTKQFKISTKLLRNKEVSETEIFKGVHNMGDRGPNSQSTACDYDPKSSVLFYTQLNKNGVSCWNTKMPFEKKNVPCIMSDCNVLQFPHDLKVDLEGDLWILSNRLSSYLYRTMNFNEVNFRILTAPITKIIKGSICEATPEFEQSQSLHKQKILKDYSFMDDKQKKIERKQKEPLPKPDCKRRLRTAPKPIEVNKYKPRHQRKSTTLNEDTSKDSVPSNKNLLTNSQRTSTKMDQLHNITSMISSHHESQCTGYKEAIKEQKKQSPFCNKKLKQKLIPECSSAIVDKLETAINEQQTSTTNEQQTITTNEQETATTNEQKTSIINLPSRATDKPQTTSQNDSHISLVTKPLDTVQNIQIVHVGVSPIKIIEKKLKFKEPLKESGHKIVFERPSNKYFEQSDHQTSPMKRSEQELDSKTETRNISVQNVSLESARTKTHDQNLEPDGDLPREISNLKLNNNPTLSKLSQQKLDSERASFRVTEQKLDLQHPPSEASESSESKLDVRIFHNTINEQELNHQVTPCKLGENISVIKPAPTELSIEKSKTYSTPITMSERHFDKQLSLNKASEPKLEYQPTPSKPREENLGAQCALQESEQKFHYPYEPSKPSKQKPSELELSKPDSQTTTKEISKQNLDFQQTPIHIQQQSLDAQLTPIELNQQKFNSEHTSHEQSQLKFNSYHIPSRISEQKLELQSTSNKVTEQLQHQLTLKELHEQKLVYRPVPEEIIVQELNSQHYPIKLNEQKFYPQPTIKMLSEPKIASQHTSLEVSEQFNPQSSLIKVTEQNENPDSTPGEVGEQILEPQNLPRQLNEPKTYPHYSSTQPSEQRQPSRTHEQESEPQYLPATLNDQELEQFEPNEEKENDVVAQPSINENLETPSLTKQQKLNKPSIKSSIFRRLFRKKK